MKALSLIEFPLDGLSLIEASAGTGKTYALANLYLRYLLECRFNVEQILVVTFTEAATQELKDRIRLRIQELRLVFEGAETQDPILNYLVSTSASKAKDQLCLRLAERQIDQAQIHTIHGFCQQVLKRHALDSSVPLKQNLLEDQTQLRKSVIEDFWRRYVLNLSKVQLHYIVSNWSEPSSLQSELSSLLNRSPKHIIPTVSGQNLTSWQEAFEAFQAWLLELKNVSLRELDDVETLLKDKPLKSNNTKLKWIHQLKVWAEMPELTFNLPKDSNKDILFLRFTRSRVISETAKGKMSPEHSYFDFLEAHFEKQIPDLAALFIAQSYPIVCGLINEAKQQQNVFSFDDLISRVSDALTSHEGINKNLSIAIGAPYQVALIDEFQDTDPQQYQIFNTLFGARSPKETPRLVLIGDPKQAIYGFRGGDIATYLRAKGDIARHSKGHLFTMDTNWRSSPAMVNAVNAVFKTASNPFMADDIPFQEVKAAKKNLDALPTQALFISQFVAEKAGKPQIEQALATQCVIQIQRLLKQADLLKLDDGKRLQHSDIAILVRSGKEGETIKDALAGQGIRATLDSQASIYESSEAQALYVLLNAVADPKDENALRRCLAEPMFGISDQQILAFNEQASIFAEYISLFESLHQKWLRSGVLAMIREALKCLGIFDFWHQITGMESDKESIRLWERSLTNWNQLAEILQKQSRSQKGHFALLRWYRDTLTAVLSGEQSNKGDSETKLRLESDAELIRIITIHKSKGLEYPFVFVPFLMSCRGAAEAWFYNAQGQLSIDLNKTEDNMQSADKERLAEDIRLLYVALTRAKYQCYIGTAAYQSNNVNYLGLRQTAWAYLLYQGQVPDKVDDASLQAQLENFQLRFPELINLEMVSQNMLLDSSFEDVENHSATQGVAVNFASPQLHANTLEYSIYDDWRVQSFTGLMHESHRLARLDHEFSVVLAQSKKMKPASSVKPNAISIFNFPKGSQAGTFLHTLFENLNFSEGILALELTYQYSSLEDFIHAKLALSNLVDTDAVQLWSDYLADWVRKVLQVPLVNLIQLSSIKEGCYFPEMQFYFSVKQCQSTHFNYLLNKYLGSQVDLDFSSFEGHLKGAIDLVFEADGQFYILDYKSNYLGDTPADYQKEALAFAMEEHRYDIQYLIYTLALHRFLKQRLKDQYAYTKHFGGVIYLFLRGLNIENLYGASDAESTGVYFVRPPEELILALDEELGRL